MMNADSTEGSKRGFSKRRRWRLMLALLTLLTASYLFYELWGVTSGVRFDVFMFLGALVGAFSLAYIVWTSFKTILDYLEPGGRRAYLEATQRFGYLAPEFHEIKKALAKIGDSIPITSPEQGRELVENLKLRLKEKAAEEVLGEIKENLAETLRRDDFYQSVVEQFKETLERLRQEIWSLSKRGNLNLALGIVTAGIGLALLGGFVFLSEPQEKAWLFLSHFVPRLTLIIFVEVFAYFFLALYKSSLSEIKYFQNEMTTIESKFASLMAALRLDDEGVSAGVISSMANTERNPTLEKGQSNAELERAKLDRDTVSQSMKGLGELIDKITKLPSS